MMQLNFDSLQKSVGYVGYVGKTAQPRDFQVSDKEKIKSDKVGYPQSVSAKLSDLSDPENVGSDTPKPSNDKDYPTYPTQKQDKPENVTANDAPLTILTFFGFLIADHNVKPRADEHVRAVLSWRPY
jgi:hypothetical protein